jgi:predicted Zn-dependent protease with MMP-like domain
MVTDRQREHFDRICERVIEQLPEQLRELLEELPMIVEDEPWADLLDEMEIEADGDLCGLHWGTPITERSIEHMPESPDYMMMFRGPVMRLARSHGGNYLDELERQIRITVLHEIGHHFGLDEDDLERLGYG